MASQLSEADRPGTSADSTSNRSSSKSSDSLNFLQWLKTKLDEEKCPGVRWLDKSTGTFSIPWKHNKRSDCGQSGLIYREWAIYTGHFRENKKASTYKRNFRSIMYKYTTSKDVLPLEYLENKDYKFFQLVCQPGSSSTSPTPMDDSTNLPGNSAEVPLHSSCEHPPCQQTDQTSPAEEPVERVTENNGMPIASRGVEEAQTNQTQEEISASPVVILRDIDNSETEGMDEEMPQPALPHVPHVTVNRSSVDYDNQLNPESISSIARELLLEGRMPILMPAPRQWKANSEVTLPGNITWPPKEYLKMTADAKLFETEYACKTLAREWNLGHLGRRDLLDCFNMLYLPDMNYPPPETPQQMARDRMFCTVMTVANGNETSQLALHLVKSIWHIPKPQGKIRELIRLLENYQIILVDYNETMGASS